jgi:hypothetical protein
LGTGIARISNGAGEVPDGVLDVPDALRTPVVENPVDLVIGVTGNVGWKIRIGRGVQSGLIEIVILDPFALLQTPGRIRAVAHVMASGNAAENVGQVAVDAG